jgi:predicted O-methyltransferase YrrM
MSPNKTITLLDGVKVCVPNSLHLISSYVLEEQLDWFEDEIKFIRKIIHSGNHVIDIGANYGVYTLSIAKLIGSTGKVYSFEPAKKTAETLLKSIEINGLKNIVIEKKGFQKKLGLQPYP